MKLITNYEQYMEEAHKILNTQSGIIRVSSFNIYAPENSVTQSLLNDIAEQDARILVGTSYHSCQTDCKACLATNQKRSNRLLTHIGSHKIRVYDNLHLKYFARGTKAITGGMNLTGSGYSDMALLIGNVVTIAEMNSHFDKIFNSFSENKLYHVTTPVFPYGKYKGSTVQEVSRKDPSYIKWAQTNFPDSIKELLKLV